MKHAKILNFLLYMMGVVSIAAYSQTPVFIENLSGWAITVFYTKDSERHEIPMRQGEEFKEIDDLDSITSLSFARRGNVWGMWAPEQSLNEILSYFKRHRAKAGHEVVIVIKATTLSWVMRGQWRKQGPESTVVEDFDFVNLDGVVAGQLGNGFARQAQEILSADYTNSDKQGFINLAHRLKSEFSDRTFKEALREKTVVVQGKVLSTKQVEVLTPAILETSQAKQIITSLYKTFTNYKARGLIQ